MEIGFVGLGRMGLNMVKRLLRGGHRVVCTSRTTSARAEATSLGAIWAETPQDFLTLMAPPRPLWAMVPSGETTEAVLISLRDLSAPGDFIIDGGNSDFRDTIRRGRLLAEADRIFVDVGTSGGIWGLEKGYCLMIGGDASPVEHLAPIFTTLAPPDGWLHVGPTGTGHLVKMVHNAIEYGMMQAYAEGFEILEKSGFPLDLQKISHLWNQGSVVRSWLLELSEDVFQADPTLKSVRGHVEDSGECRWAVETAMAESIPAPVLAAALFSRFSSRNPDAFSHRYLASLRNAFGGHAVKKTNTDGEPG
jgi:6-phosphogluconate dehydrogenase